jgi:glycosyltransferase involved in cell wall biosynthesis
VQTVVQNEDDHGALVRSGWLGKDAQLIVIRGSGVDLASFTPRTDREEGDLVVLFAGRLLATKGVRELVAAAHLLAAREVPVRVRIAGEPDPGNPESIDEDIVTKWRNEAVVEMPGHVDDIVAELMNAQIAVLPSEREGVPRFLLEAAAAGVPSVATDVPGNRDVIDHEETGLLIESADPIAIADAIERLVRSPTLRSEMGARARSKAEENFSIERVATAYVDLVVQSVGGSPSSLRFEP